MKVIGIDIDDTITETTITGNKYIKAFNDAYNYSYKSYHDLPKDRYFDFLNMFLQDIVKNNIVKDYVKEAFDYLHNNDYKIVIITARNNVHIPNIKELTKEFLDNNGIEYDKIIFDDLDIKDKSGAVKENNVDIFIDDREEVLDKISKVGVECLRITTDKNSKYKTFANWQDILKYLKTKEG